MTTLEVRPWAADLLGEGYQQRIIDLGEDPDGEGAVAAGRDSATCPQVKLHRQLTTAHTANLIATCFIVVPFLKIVPENSHTFSLSMAGGCYGCVTIRSCFCPILRFRARGDRPPAIAVVSRQL